jgi:hypothetical protein
MNITIIRRHPPTRETTLVSGVNSTATTIVLASGIATAKALLVNGRTKEQIYVVSHTAGATCVVRRGIGTLAQAMVAGDPIFVLSAAQSENGSFVESQDWDRTHLSALAQQFEAAIEMSDWRKLLKTVGVANEWNDANQRAAMEFEERIEDNMLLGRPSRFEDSGSRLVQTIAGLDYWASLENNIHMRVGTLKCLATVLAGPLDFANGNALGGFCSRKVLSMITDLPRSAHCTQTTTKDSTFGWDINKLVFSGGVLNLIHHRAMDRSGFDKAILGFNVDCLSKWEPDPYRVVKQGPEVLGRWAEKAVLTVTRGLVSDLPEGLFKIDGLEWFA